MSVVVGKINSLRVNELAYEGAYLTDTNGENEVFLPKEHVQANLKEDDTLSAFVYQDSDNQLIATLKDPIAQLGDFKLLRVKEINRTGAFIDIGIERDVLVPFNEQRPKMSEGQSYLVHLYLDKASQRLCASSHLNRFVSSDAQGYKRFQEVEIIIAGRTDLGYKVIVDKKYWGVIYNNSVFKKIYVGQTFTAYINKQREDGKLDIVLDKPGIEKSHALADSILNKLAEENGVLPVGDKSAPELIKRLFGTSKANFKKAIGHLYKTGKIELEATQIKLIK